MKLRSLILPGALLAVVTPLVAFAEEIPLKNWTVPEYSPGGDRKALDVTSPRAFIGVRPCRIIDTRGGAPLGGGILTDSEARNFTVTGSCGLPPGTDAISANFTVTGSPAAPPGAFILAYPTGNPPSPIVSLLNFQAGQTIANGAIVPLSGSGQITINVSHSTHVIMDINGYFSHHLDNTNQSFVLETSSFATASMIVSNTNTGWGVGIQGNAYGTGGTGAFAYGVGGAAVGTTGSNVFGVFGSSSSFSFGAAGVKGLHRSALSIPGTYPPSGVHGESSNGNGVFGLARVGFGVGVVGTVVSTSLAFLAEGYLGHSSGGTHYGLYSVGAIGASGTKFFVEPHPEKADMVIRYAALEGPESGTYFRGKGKFQRGVARIEIPEDFRLVTDPEGLSVQVTPIGGMATVGVLRIGLDGIVVQGSRDLEFFYMVNGVRRSHKGLQPIGPGREYMPASADARMPAYLTEVQKQMLVSNGTYLEDGTVNLEKARVLGWDKVWKERAGQK